MLDRNASRAWNGLATFGSCLALILASLDPQPARAQDNTQQPAPKDVAHSATPPLPTLEELEARHAKIGAIVIRNGNVFDTDDPKDDHALFRLANRLHVRTRPAVIAEQLLLKPGDTFSIRRLRESERILRKNRYLYDAHIVPTSYHDGSVDLEVRTRDVWTFKPSIQYGRSGGRNTTGVEIQESNVLGFGKEITAVRKHSVDRTTTELRYYDPNLFGSFDRLQLSYSQNSDGRQRQFYFERPFYSLDTHWSYLLSALDGTGTDARYDLGRIVDDFRHDQGRYIVGGGWSPGWRHGWVTRFNFGFESDRDRFAPGTDTLAAQQVPADKRLTYPFVGITWLQDDYEERRNENQIERTEDLYAGTYLQARIGNAQPAWGADRSAWLWSVAGGTSLESPLRRHTLVMTAAASGRLETGVGRNEIVTGEATYYWRAAPRQLFYMDLRGIATKDLDAETQVLLGGDNGLRGYPLRYQDGKANVLLTVEHRIFTRYYLFRLFHVGGAAFFDIGRSFGSGNARFGNQAALEGIDPNQGTLKDLGVGLRFGSSRSAFGNVIHVDLAFPLDGDPSIKRVQFLVQTKTSF